MIDNYIVIVHAPFLKSLPVLQEQRCPQRHDAAVIRHALRVGVVAIGSHIAPSSQPENGHRDQERGVVPKPAEVQTNLLSKVI